MKRYTKKCVKRVFSIVTVLCFISSQTIAHAVSTDVNRHYLAISKELRLEDYLTFIQSQKYDSSRIKLENETIKGYVKKLEQDFSNMHSTFAEKNYSDYATREWNDNIRNKIVLPFMRLGKHIMNRKEKKIDDYLLAIKCFKNVKRYRRIKKSFFEEIAKESSIIPEQKFYPKFSNEKVKEIDDVKTICNSAINNAKALCSLGEMIVHNIEQGLNLRLDDLCSGGGKVNGAAFSDLYEAMTKLRKFIQDKNKKSIHKCSALLALDRIASVFMSAGNAKFKLNERGIMAPEEIQKDLDKNKSFNNYLDWEQKVWNIFSFNKYSGIKKGTHSKNALDWLRKMYKSMFIVMKTKVQKEMLKDAGKKLGLKDWDEVVLKNKNKSKKFEALVNSEYKDITIKKEYINSKDIMFEAMACIRQEFDACGAGDSLPAIGHDGRNSSVLNASSAQVDANGNLIKNVNPTISISERQAILNRYAEYLLKSRGEKVSENKINSEAEKIKKEKGGLPYMVIYSVDMGFDVPIFDISDILNKSKATLILDPITQTGILPNALLKKAQEQAKNEVKLDVTNENYKKTLRKKEREYLDIIWKKLFGGNKDKGLEIKSNVIDIEPRSGMAISNVIPMAISNLLFVLTGKTTLTEKNGKFFIENKEDIDRAAYSTQSVIVKIGSDGGIQDNASLYKGSPFIIKSDGTMIPQVVNIKISDQVKEKISKQMKVFRIGISEPGDATLLQYVVSHLTNNGVDYSDVWHQFGLEMLIAFKKGDIEQMGRIASAEMCLRHKLAPNSINQVVINAINNVMKKWSDNGKSIFFGIMGARSTGSVISYFPDYITDDDKKEIDKDFKQALKEASAKAGDPLKRDNEVISYDFKISTDGMEVNILKEENAINQRRKKDEKQTIDNSKKQSIDEVVKDYIYKDEENVNAKTENSVCMIPDNIYKTLFEKKKKKDNKEEEITKELGEHFDNTYKVFSGTADIDFNKKMGKIIAFNSDKLKLIDNDIKSFFYQAVQKGKINLLRTFTKEDINKIDGLKEQKIKDVDDFIEKINVLKIENINVSNDIDKTFKSLSKQEGEKESVKEKEEGSKKQPKNFICLTDQKFWNQVNKDIKKWKNIVIKKNKTILNLKKKQDKTDKEERELRKHRRSLNESKRILKILNLKPFPEDLPVDHILFEKTESYKQFKPALDKLKEKIKSGRLGIMFLLGGMGTRFLEGLAGIKGAIKIEYDKNSDNTFAEIAYKRIMLLMKKYNSKIAPLIMSLVSPLTKQAINAALKIAYERGEFATDKSGKVVLTVQKLQEVIYPEKLELLIAKSVAMKDVASKEKEVEIARIYDEQIRKLKEKKIKADAKYNPTGNRNDGSTKYAPAGSGMCIENIGMDYKKEFGFKTLKGKYGKLNNNYNLQESHLQNKNEMTFLDAALLWDIPITIFNGSNLKGGINSLYLGKACELMGDGEKISMVVSYTAKGAGICSGGVLAMKDGKIVVLEMKDTYGNKEKLIKFPFITTGDVCIHPKAIVRLLGFDNPAEYLMASKEKRENKLKEAKKKWYKSSTIKKKKDVGVGIIEEDFVKQVETPLVKLTELLEGFQSGSVMYMQVREESAFNDPKIQSELYEQNARTGDFYQNGARQDIELEEKKIKITKEEIVFKNKIKREIEKRKIVVNIKDRKDFEEKYFEMFNKYNVIAHGEFNLDKGYGMLDKRAETNKQGVEKEIKSNMAKILKYINYIEDKEDKDSDYMKTELNAIYEQLMSVLLRINNKKHFNVITPHKQITPKDKDDTMAPPSEPLSPRQAEMELMFAVRGQRGITLTGSTGYETVITYFEPLIDVAEKLYEAKKLSFVQIKTAFSRMIGCANDAGIILSYDVDFDDEGLNFTLKHGLNKYWDDREKKWKQVIDLKKTNEDGTVNKTETLRKKLFNWSCQAYFKRLFSTGIIQEALKEINKDINKDININDFIEQLKTLELAFDKDDYNAEVFKEKIGDEKDRSMLEPDKNKLNDSFISMDKIFKRMVNRKGNKFKYKKLCETMLNKDGVIKTALEKIAYKESYWIFGSITGDHLNKAFQKEDAGNNVKKVGKAILVDKQFWDDIKKDIDEKIMKNSKGKGLFLTKTDGTIIPIRSRKGSGYYNWIAGGASKVNLTMGLAKSDGLNYEVMTLIGDSPTDQGELYPVIIYKDKIGNKTKDFVKKVVKEKDYIHSDKEGNIRFSRMITKDELNKIRDNLNVDEQLLNVLYEELENFYVKKIILRALLADSKELSAQKLRDFRQAQVLRVDYAGAFDPEKGCKGFYHCGPKTYYHIMDYIVKLGEQGLVLEKYNDAHDYNLNIIKEYNKDAPSGFKMYKPINPHYKANALKKPQKNKGKKEIKKVVKTKEKSEEKPKDKPKKNIILEPTVTLIISLIMGGIVSAPFIAFIGGWAAAIGTGISALVFFSYYSTKGAIALRKFLLEHAVVLHSMLYDKDINFNNLSNKIKPDNNTKAQKQAQDIFNKVKNIILKNNNKDTLLVNIKKNINKIKIKTSSSKFGFCAMQGKTLYFNSKKIKNINNKDCEYIMIHQILHELAGYVDAKANKNIIKKRKDTAKALKDKNVNEYINLRTELECAEVENELILLLTLLPNLAGKYNITESKFLDNLINVHGKDFFRADPYKSIFENLKKEVSQNKEEPNWIKVENIKKIVKEKLSEKIKEETEITIKA